MSPLPPAAASIAVINSSSAGIGALKSNASLLSDQQQNCSVGELLLKLSSKHRSTQEDAAEKLALQINSLTYNMTTETVSRNLHEVNRKLHDLVRSTEQHERMGAVLAIYQLALHAEDDILASLPRYANYVRAVLPGRDIPVMVEAARTLSKLIERGGSFALELIEYETRRMFEWIKERNSEVSQVAAVLIAGTLLRSSPYCMADQIESIIGGMVSCWLDSKFGSAHEFGVQMLEALVQVILQSSDQVISPASRQEWLGRLKGFVKENFKSFSSVSPIPTLLLLQVLCQEAPSEFTVEEVREITDCLLMTNAQRLLQSKDPSVRHLVLSLVPRLASIKREIFCKEYLKLWMSILGETLKREKDRKVGLQSLSSTAAALGDRICGELGGIFSGVLQQILLSKAKQRIGDDDGVMECISLVAEHCGPSLFEHIKALLPAIILNELSPQLRKTLLSISVHVQGTMPFIQDPVLEAVSRYLHRAAISDSLVVGASQDSRVSVLLALETLAGFQFSEPVLDGEIGKNLSRLLSSRMVPVRMAALRALAQLASPRDKAGRQYESHASIDRAVQHILQSAVGDGDGEVRDLAIRLLQSGGFERFLATEPGRISTLVGLLNDSGGDEGAAETRLVVADILGQIGKICRAGLIQHIRGILGGLLADLRNPTQRHRSNQQASSAALVLSRIVQTTDHQLVLPYVGPLIQNLLPKISESDPPTVSAVLATLSSLLEVDPGRFRAPAASLFDALMDILQDLSSSKRRLAALNCLASLIRNVDRRTIQSDRYGGLVLQLVELLKIELSRPVRNALLMVFGVVGAIDPYRMKSREIALLSSSNGGGLVSGGLLDENSNAGNLLFGTDVPLGSEEYFVSVAIAALIKILRDPSLTGNHLAATQALLFVLRSLGPKSCVSLPHVLPSIYAIIRSCSPQVLDFYFSHLAMLVGIVGVHVRPWVPELVGLLEEFWAPSAPVQLSLLALTEALTVAVQGEQHAELQRLVPMVIGLLPLAIPDRPGLLGRTMNALVAFGGLLQDYTALLVDTLLVNIKDASSISREMSLTLLQAIRSLVWQVRFSASAPGLARVLVLLIGNGDDGLMPQLVDDIAVGMAYYDPEAIYLAVIERAAEKGGFELGQLAAFCAKGPSAVLSTSSTMLNVGVNCSSSASSFLSPTASPYASLSVSLTDLNAGPAGSIPRKFEMNEQNLRRSWDSYGCQSKEDWFEWIRRLGVELLKESPAPALRACSVLAALNYPLARELFNAAFVSCWAELDEMMQAELIGYLEAAMASDTIPPEVTQILLNLAEFLEHEESALPIDISSLGAYAIRCHAFAKALYYKELEFQSGPPSPALVEALISINSQIQLPDAAVGILVSAQETWYEKLQRWDDALDAYQRRWQEDPTGWEALLGVLRCQHALGDWDRLSETAASTWTRIGEQSQSVIAPLAAVATWGLGRWEEMTEYVGAINEASPEGSFFRTVLAVHRLDFDEARQGVWRTRELIDTELTAMVSESYSRAYNTVVRVQMLAELEEVMAYHAGGAGKRSIIKQCWAQRLEDCQENVDVWQRILKIRSLVLQPPEDVEGWIKFSGLCSRSGRPLLARRVLLSLLHTDDRNLDHLDLSKARPVIVYAFLKHNWELGEREKALKFMRLYTRHMAHRIDQMSAAQAGGDNAVGIAEVEEQSKLLARCYLKLAEWQKICSLEDGSAGELSSSILEAYLAATSYDKSWYKAWHGWALTNFEMAAIHERTWSNRSGESSTAAPRRPMNPHIVPAVQGFFRSIGLAPGGSCLQDALRLLTLWFKYGVLPEVNAAVGDGIYAVPVDSWLQVLPQLIARIHVPSPQVRRLIHQVLSDIGRHHPQALVYPLTVSSKSQSIARRTSALAILDKMRSHSAVLVEQAMLVSQELIRVAILWEEQWHEALEEASKVYFGDQNVPAMLALLEPLHQGLERRGDAGQTQREASFAQAYGKELREARELCLRYRRSSNMDDLNAAWDLYYQVFRRISKLLPQMASLDLQQCSPQLYNARDLELAVPGTYRASTQPVIRIASVSPTLSVIASKQRPRRLTMIGSDGQRYRFLLKGHEDLRQDERVMQLFRLVNALLDGDPETGKRHLGIERFAVVPLSQNTGLIGWVPHCDTLHTLIKEHREARGVLLSVEHRLMLQFAPDYDHLMVLQKVEAFSHAMDNTDGRDLARIQWKRSRNAEAWLDRRTVYTRSLAVMSMVGYVLGLGDRHPSNLMIDQLTGRIVHIDFGDCFEVAMHRDRYPEAIPFRLTRMLTKAMEVGEVEGTFRLTCEHTMRVLRENRDSVMAVLEAFVYDPLINWRLLSSTTTTTTTATRSFTGNLAVSSYSNVMAAVEETGAYPESISSSKQIRRRLGDIHRLEEESINRPEALNAGAVNVINRVSNKLTGRDFPFHQQRHHAPMGVAEQVDRLIQQAVQVENLCQAYVGWCPFW